MGVRASESPLVLETIARVLLSLGGEPERALIRQRAERSDARTREQLMSLLRR